MIQSSLEIIRAIQDDHERKAEQIYLRKQIPRTKSPFVRRLEWLGKDVIYLASRLVSRKSKTA
jgi:hypothetical protein